MKKVLIQYILFILLLSTIMDDVRELRIGCWNCIGFRSSAPYIVKLLENHDVLAISEHWLHNNRLRVLNELSQTHAVHARASRHSSDEHNGSRRGQAGVAIFWRKSISGFSAVTDIVHDRICALRYQDMDGNVIIFISVYMPAQGSPEDLATCLDDLSEIVETREIGARIVIAGDFNGDLGSVGTSRGKSPPTPQGLKVYSFFNRHNLTAVNMLPTTVGPVHTCLGPNFKSTLDYIAVGSDILSDIESCSVLGYDVLNTSDHQPLSCHLKVKSIVPVTMADDRPKRVKWEKLTPESLRYRYVLPLEPDLIRLASKLRSSVVTEHLIVISFEQLINLLHKASDKLPKSRFRIHQKPYWNDEMDLLKASKLNDYRQWVEAGRNTM